MNDFIQVCRQLRIKTRSKGEHHHARAGWVQVNCPYCPGGEYSNTWHLGINLTTGRANCWKCGPRSLPHTLAKLSGQPLRVVRAALDGVVFAALRHTRNPGTLRLPETFGMWPRQRQYLEGRGFDPDELIALWGLRSCPPVGQLAHRIFIPVQHNYETISYTTRSIYEHGKRYVSAPAADEALPHKDVLYGADYCTQVAMVHEGPSDVWATGPGAVCTFGIVVSPAQVAALARFALRVICFDATASAQRRARKLAARLATVPGKTIIAELDAGDPATCTAIERKELRAYLK